MLVAEGVVMKAMSVKIVRCKLAVLSCDIIKGLRVVLQRFVIVGFYSWGWFYIDLELL